jgi:NitT/TauT family transport system permease protein
MSVALALADGRGARTAARRNLAIRLASIAFILAIWEIVGLLVPPIFLAPFHQTVIAFFELTADGALPRATLATLAVLFLGLSIAIILGVAIGLLMGRYRTVRWVLEPYVNGLYSTPTVAFLPLVTFWLGLYLAPKIAIVVLIAIFPMLKNTAAGVATVGTDYLEPAESMRASELALFIKVIMPATLPFIMAGVRLAIGRGIVGVVVGEFFTAQSGLGGMVVFYASKFQTAEMFVPIIVLVTVGVCLTELAKRLQSVLAPWKESERDQGF